VLLENSARLNVSKQGEILTKAEVVKDFPATKQGVQLRKRVHEHNLIGQGCYREWLDLNGVRKEIYGIIVIGWLASDGKLFYTVEYEYHKSCQQLRKHLQVADHNVAEDAAWGGYIAFLGVTKSQQVVLPVPFHLKWILPKQAALAGEMLKIEYQGFTLQFFVTPKGINIRDIDRFRFLRFRIDIKIANARFCEIFKVELVAPVIPQAARSSTPPFAVRGNSTCSVSRTSLMILANTVPYAAHS
jgi:hypothetical protein